MEIARQGDVQFIRISAIPEAAQARRGRMLFEGEATGHAHVADGGLVFATSDGILYLRADAPVNILHEEHRTLALEPGFYMVSQKRQLAAATWKSPEGWRSGRPRTSTDDPLWTEVCD